MMNIYLTFLVVAALTSVSMGVEASSSAYSHFKCSTTVVMPGYRGSAVPIFDGEILGKLSDIDSLNVGSIEVKCWDPESGEFGEIGVPVVFALSKEAMERPGRALRDMAEAEGLAQPVFDNSDANRQRLRVLLEEEAARSLRRMYDERTGAQHP